MISTDTPANVIHDGDRGASKSLGALVHDPRAAALVCLELYLGFSAVVLGTGRHLWLVALHVAGLEAVRRTLAPRCATARTIGDLLPLFVLPLMYAEIPLLIGATRARLHDGVVQGWELALFGGVQPAQSLARALPYRWLSETLHAAYLAYYVVIFIPPLLLVLRGQRRAFGETVLALTITYSVCWTIFAFFPVEGPRYLWAAPAGIPDGPVRRLALAILASGSSRGAAFPSSHMAIAVVQTLMAWRWQRRAVVVLAPVAALIGVGAVYGGFHYAVDMLAGTALAVVVVAIVVRTSAAQPR